MENLNIPIDNNWATPKDFYDQLDAEFKFDFDPCPYDHNPQTDGLQVEWGKSNFINPPYSRKLKEQFVKRAIAESKKGNSSVMLLPVSTSTSLFHDHIKPNADEIRFVKNRIRFQKKDAEGNYYTPQNFGMRDSMIIIFKAA